MHYFINVFLPNCGYFIVGYFPIIKGLDKTPPSYLRWRSTTNWNIATPTPALNPCPNLQKGGQSDLYP